VLVELAQIFALQGNTAHMLNFRARVAGRANLFWPLQLDSSEHSVPKQEI